MALDGLADLLSRRENKGVLSSNLGKQACLFVPGGLADLLSRRGNQVFFLVLVTFLA
jgi:hypothetical protein